MKTVMRNDMVAHVWAQQSQAEARNAQWNFYFDHDTIYSYGGHFPIARFVRNDSGVRAVVFTTRTYSNTTNAKHIADTRGALRGLDVPVFNLKEVGISTRPFSRDVKKDYESRIEITMDDAARARLKVEWHLARAVDLAEEANECAVFFGWAWRLEIPSLSPEKIQAARKAVREAGIAKREETARREAALKVEAAEALGKFHAGRAEWLAGAPVDYPYISYRVRHLVELPQLGTELRVVEDQVETSRGAVIPVAHAKRIWPVILKHKREGKEFQASGHKLPVGHFTIDRIEVTGDIKAGCHHIAFPEIEKIAAVLGLAA